MRRVLSIASSFFAASFIVLMFLGLLAWGVTAALADEPLIPQCLNNCDHSDGHCELYDCDQFCCCDCDTQCDCNKICCPGDPGCPC
jgi:hypothetical protein